MVRPCSPLHRTVVLAFAAFAASSCTTDGHSLDREALMDPQTCEECHPHQYRQWVGSMHAYSTEDPYVQALNALGQEQTDGALGDLCMRCHAPMAWKEGEIVDGLGVSDLPSHLQGVTCYVCHTVEGVEGLNNNQLVFGAGTTMLGPVDDPVENDAHGSSYSVFHDGRALESSDLCGSCHDVVTPGGLEVERAYLEWRDSLYSDRDSATGGAAYYSQRCNSCHMPGTNGPIADADGAGVDRRRHDHSIPGFAVPVTDFPEDEGAKRREEQLEAMAEFRQGVLCASVCVTPLDDGGFEPLVWLHNETSGHHWPTGAGQDRRAWVHLSVFAGDELLYESGNVPDGTSLHSQVEADEDLWWFGDTLFDADDQRVHALWQADRYEPRNLPVVEQLGGDPETWRSRVYPRLDVMPDRVELRVKTRAMPLDLLDELVEAGHLSQKLRDALPTFDVEPVHLDWTPDTAVASEIAGSCVSSSTSCASPHI